MTDTSEPRTDTPPSEAPDEALDAETSRQFLIKNLVYTFIAILVVVALAAGARHLFGDQLAATSTWLTTRGGYAGVFLSTWAIDTFTLPVSPDIILAFVAHEGGRLDHALALALICVASVAGGNTGFYLARRLGRLGWVERRLAKSYRSGQRLFQRFGVWAVVIAGLTPVPFSIVCWLAGLYHMSAFKLFLATLSRIPRFVGWYYVILLGFSL